jgi:hypothetical protein
MGQSKMFIIQKNKKPLDAPSEVRNNYYKSPYMFIVVEW